MAKDLKGQLSDSKSKLERLQDELVKLQEKFRRDSTNATVRADLNAHKQDIAVAAEEHAELSRAHALAQGGTNHRPG